MRPASGAAAWLVAGVAWAAAAPRAVPVPAACEVPRVVAAREGLVAVSCRAQGAPLAGAARLVFGLALDLNRADARALEALPGIGAGRAAAIVRARAEAPFCSVADLARVPGFGAATRARLAGRVTVAPGAGCAAERS